MGGLESIKTYKNVCFVLVNVVLIPTYKHETRPLMYLNHLFPPKTVISFTFGIIVCYWVRPLTNFAVERIVFKCILYLSGCLFSQ